MISVAYVNGTHEDILSLNTVFDKDINTIVESVESEYNDYEKHYSEFLIESETSGFEDLDEIAMLESEGDNVFAKIGNAIIAVLKKFREGLQKLIKNDRFKNKSDMDKIDALIKAHPNLKDQIVGHASDFNFKELENIAQMEKAFNDIMAMSDPKSMEARWKKTKTVAAGAVTVAAGTVTIAKAIDLIKNATARTEREARESLNNAARFEQQCRQTLANNTRNLENLRERGVRTNDPRYVRGRQDTAAARQQLQHATQTYSEVMRDYNATANRLNHGINKILRVLNGRGNMATVGGGN